VRVPLLVAAAAIILALAYWVWPTPYRYVIPREPRIQVVRINRFTGDADYLLLNGWHRAKLPPGAKGPLKLDELLRDGQ
jgi:hypothetical protein